MEQIMAKKLDELNSKANETSTIVADVDRVLDILRTMPVLKRYSDDNKALKEAEEILQGIKGKL